MTTTITAAEPVQRGDFCAVNLQALTFRPVLCLHPQIGGFAMAAFAAGERGEWDSDSRQITMKNQGA